MSRGKYALAGESVCTRGIKEGVMCFRVNITGDLIGFRVNIVTGDLISFRVYIVTGHLINFRVNITGDLISFRVNIVTGDLMSFRVNIVTGDLMSFRVNIVTGDLMSFRVNIVTGDLMSFRVNIVTGDLMSFRVNIVTGDLMNFRVNIVTGDLMSFRVNIVTGDLMSFRVNIVTGDLMSFRVNIVTGDLMSFRVNIVTGDLMSFRVNIVTGDLMSFRVNIVTGDLMNFRVNIVTGDLMSFRVNIVTGDPIRFRVNITGDLISFRVNIITRDLISSQTCARCVGRPRRLRGRAAAQWPPLHEPVPAEAFLDVGGTEVARLRSPHPEGQPAQQRPLHLLDDPAGAAHQLASQALTADGLTRSGNPHSSLAHPGPAEAFVTSCPHWTSLRGGGQQPGSSRACGSLRYLLPTLDQSSRRRAAAWLIRGLRKPLLPPAPHWTSLRGGGQQPGSSGACGSLCYLLPHIGPVFEEEGSSLAHPGPAEPLLPPAPHWTSLRGGGQQPGSSRACGSLCYLLPHIGPVFEEEGSSLAHPGPAEPSVPPAHTGPVFEEEGSSLAHPGPAEAFVTSCPTLDQSSRRRAAAWLIQGLRKPSVPPAHIGPVFEEEGSSLAHPGPAEAFVTSCPTLDQSSRRRAAASLIRGLRKPLLPPAHIGPVFEEEGSSLAHPGPAEAFGTSCPHWTSLRGGGQQPGSSGACGSLCYLLPHIGPVFEEEGSSLAHPGPAEAFVTSCPTLDQSSRRRAAAWLIRGLRSLCYLLPHIGPVFEEEGSSLAHPGPAEAFVTSCPTLDQSSRRRAAAWLIQGLRSLRYLLPTLDQSSRRRAAAWLIRGLRKPLLPPAHIGPVFEEEGSSLAHPGPAEAFVTSCPTLDQSSRRRAAAWLIRGLRSLRYLLPTLDQSSRRRAAAWLIQGLRKPLLPPAHIGPVFEEEGSSLAHPGPAEAFVTSCPHWTSLRGGGETVA
ncbi:hypothetical protein NDU88_007380 [Pleurodeles waltl]|uniref:Uncharacterized protein n=1 Tax=Pleurodeles waltl TaxID=8319 RepID=A0AAV7WH71_PLEWA|nr:hypothetical protein NDU88_007380 [Pleurodeles waltl]